MSVSLYHSTLNISPLHLIRLMEKASMTECTSDITPRRAGMVGSIKVKVGISPLGGVAVVLTDIISLRGW